MKPEVVKPKKTSEKNAINVARWRSKANKTAAISKHINKRTAACSSKALHPLHCYAEDPTIVTTN